jgi:hypothetical protein
MSQDKILKNQLVCTVTGKTVSVAPKVFDQRAAKYGSADVLKSNYISALGRKLLCAGKTVDEIRKELVVPESVPVPSQEVVLKYTRWAKYRKPKTSNERQDQAIQEGQSQAV